MAREKRATVYLQYKCKNGSSTVAATASMGLLHWYGRIMPTKPIENPRPFEIHICSTQMPAPYHPSFLPLVIAGLERTFGKAPEIPPHLEEWNKRFAGDPDFREVEKQLKKGTSEFVEYEAVCLEILHWLKEQGEIREMSFNKPIEFGR